ncbi:hypothetical protein PVAND_011725 [Polypedilum vanderplanki]|uniref:Arrestin C-terminal-like domain-containing protein n=1 Tax=Polypedilum vanderplanki TaxID=319348 RepID=A0A9J6CJH8_POLVA|nr:hypothetical protein PVAND_011725 [Polypedilum vanderplanki]
MSSSNYSLEIFYDDNCDSTASQPIFYPGQTVKGHVQLSISSTTLKLRGLSLLIKGSASCNYSKDLQAEQEFFAVERKLIETKLDSIELAAGSYNYDFEYRLPRNIPYSVDGQYGNVKYFVQASIDIPWDLYDKKVVKPFIVVRYEDLNYMSGMREPCELLLQKQIDSSAWFFSRSSLGLVTIKANLLKCGFAPGEKVIVDASIDNQTSADIETVSIALYYNENYTAQTPWAKLEEKVSNKISETIADGVKAGFTKKIKESVLVPENSKITSVMYSTVFQINYHVQITAKFRRVNIPLLIPIYIGSVALRKEEECENLARVPPLWPPSLNIIEKNGTVKSEINNETTSSENVVISE